MPTRLASFTGTECPSGSDPEYEFQIPNSKFLILQLPPQGTIRNADIDLSAPLDISTT